MKIKLNVKFSSSVTLSKLQVLNSHMCVEATLLAAQLKNICIITESSVGLEFLMISCFAYRKGIHGVLQNLY